MLLCADRTHYLVGILLYFLLFFFFNDTATTEIYTLSLHDALPIRPGLVVAIGGERRAGDPGHQEAGDDQEDRRRPPQTPGPVVASHLSRILPSPAGVLTRGHQDTFPYSQSIGLGWRGVKTLRAARWFHRADHGLRRRRSFVRCLTS